MEMLQKLKNNLFLFLKTKFFQHVYFKHIKNN